MTPSCMFKRVLRCQRRFRKPPDRLQGTQYTHGVCSLTYLLWIQARRAGGTSMGHRPVDSLRDTSLISEQPCNLLLQRRRYSTLNIWVNKEDYMPQRGNFPFFLTNLLSCLYCTSLVGARVLCDCSKIKLVSRRLSTRLMGHAQRAWRHIPHFLHVPFLPPSFSCALHSSVLYIYRAFVRKRTMHNTLSRALTRLARSLRMTQYSDSEYPNEGGGRSMKGWIGLLWRGITF